MKQLLSTLCVIISLNVFSQDAFMIPADAEQFYNRSFPVLPLKQRQAIERFTANSTTETGSDSILARLKALPVFEHAGPAALDSLALYAMVRFSTNDLATMKGLLAQIKRSEAVQKTQPPPTVTRTKAPQTDEERKRIKTAEIEETLDIKLQRIVDRRTAMNTGISQLMQRINRRPATN